MSNHILSTTFYKATHQNCFHVLPIELLYAESVLIPHCTLENVLIYPDTRIVKTFSLWTILLSHSKRSRNCQLLISTADDGKFGPTHWTVCTSSMIPVEIKFSKCSIAEASILRRESNLGMLLSERLRISLSLGWKGGMGYSSCSIKFLIEVMILVNSVENKFGLSVFAAGPHLSSLY